MKSGKLVAVIIIVGLILLAIVFGKVSQNSSSSKMVVTTSFYPLYFLTSQLGGDKVEVVNITPAGVEPHDYEPTAQDMVRIGRSKMLVLNGGIEPWAKKIRDNLNGNKVEIVVAGEGKVGLDPHIWLDPQLAKQEAAKISDGLIKIDPASANYYQDNQKKLNQQLDKLDGDFKMALTNCKQKDFITSHAAFGYLASRYGLNQLPIAGLSPDAEPSSQALVELAKFAKEHNVKYIFFESLVSPKLAQTIANEVGAKTLVLDPLEGLSDDNVKSGKDYFSVMYDNLKNLQIALECNN